MPATSNLSTSPYKTSASQDGSTHGPAQSKPGTGPSASAMAKTNSRHKQLQQASVKTPANPMNADPTIDNDPSNPPSQCHCCGRRLPQSKPTKPLSNAQARQYQKDVRSVIQAQVEQQSARQRAQRLIDRADYLHVIPFHKRYSSPSLADELKYEFLGRLEQAAPEDRSGMFQPCSEVGNESAGSVA